LIATFFAQALINPAGAAAKCIEAVHHGELLLFVSKYVLLEIRNLALK
jgi:predicted nucleic acid-binding protein